ncbi:hypothetical protein [Streptomyces pristinaespiralis]|uniref:hypothetical protein n=1 Tax=Streptomyces pristinaespiralis TaxID=38300 RepID=UPI00383251ED
MADQWWANVRERAGKDHVDALIMRIAMNAGPGPGALTDPDADVDARPDAAPGLRQRPSADPGAPDLVTRLLCSALYVRPSRIGKRLLERRLRRERAGRTWRGRRRTVFMNDEGTCPPLGEAAARWVVRHVLHGPRLPVPSFGFDLLPVVSHSLRARRIRRLRHLALLVVTGLVALIAPTAAGLWAAAALLGAVITGGRAGGAPGEKPGDGSDDAGGNGSGKAAGRAGKEPGDGPGPAWTSGAGLLLWIPPLVGVFAPWSVLDDEGRAWTLLLPLVWLLCAWPVYFADRLIARRSVYRLLADAGSPAGTGSPAGGARRTAGGDALWTPSFGRLRQRRAAELAEGQVRPEHPYDAQQRFVGAGLDLWAPAVPTTSLRATGAGDGGDAEESARSFGEAELLEHIGAALLRIEEAEGLTEPLPGFSVTQVVGIQAPLWLIRARGSKHTEPVLHDSRYAPSGRPERLYLRARCVTWQGQVTVTMFVNVALEAGRLRLTLRPHVMAPLHNRLILNVLREMLPLYQVVMSNLGESLLDACTGALAPWYRRRETHGRVQDPVSVREHFSMSAISDMHQSDDERRLVVLMESCVFDAVSSFLKDHGIDSGSFDQQVSVIINNIQVFGDNLAPIQSVAGAQVTGSSQHAGTDGAARARAGRGATRRNAE